MKSGSKNSGAGPAYLLGHSDEELDRLGRQAKLVDPMTRRFFERAGIGPGMRVLDIGSGAGDVAFLVADLVGPAGQVVGIDRSPIALKAARARAESRSLRHVSFQEGDPDTATFDSAFDAAVGRYVLMFQADPVSMLRAVARHVRPKGIVVFHEIDWAGARTFPTAPLYEKCIRWIVEALERNGLESRMGIKLHAAFVAAGLPAPTLGLEAIISGGHDEERVRYISELIENLEESIQALGVSASEIGLETLAERIAAEAIANRSVLASRSEIGAWSRLA